MKFERLLDIVADLPWFDLATVAQMTGDSRGTVINQLHRFARGGKVVALRRGMYVLAKRYRKQGVSAAQLAGAIYRPSYLSEKWALSYYGLIPEGVPVYTSVTTRKPARFVNEFGRFEYRHVKQTLFSGYNGMEISGRRVMIATPEKALLDLWHLSRGEWTVERIGEMRFSRGESISSRKLSNLVDEIGKPRIRRAFESWQRVMAEESDGEVLI